MVVAYLPSLAIQLGLSIGSAAIAIAGLMARVGRVLDPAWVIVALVYLIGPVGFLATELGLELSLLAVIAVSFAPFAIAALLVSPEARSRLVLMTPLVALVLLFAISIAWSPAAGYGMEKLSTWIIGALVPASYVFVLTASGRQVSWKIVGVAAILYASALLLIGGRNELYPDRVTLLEENPIWAARAVYLGSLAVLFSPFRLFVKVTTVPMMVAAGLVTASLGPLVGLIAGALAGLALLLWQAGKDADYGRSTARRARAGWFIVGFAVASGALVLASGILDSLLGPVVSDPNVTSRAGFLDAAIENFLGSPLLGIGGGGFAAIDPARYPHNMLVEATMELGVAGTGLLVLWTSMAIVGALRSPLLIALVVATATYSLFSGSLATNVEFWIVSALAVAGLPLALRPAVRLRRSVVHPSGAT